MSRTACFSLLCVSFLAAPAMRAADPDPRGIEFFEKKIRPVLVEHCFKCHSEEAKKSKGGLRVDTRESLLKGGDSGQAFIPGKTRDSLLLKAIHYKNVDLQMPPKGKLPEAVIADFEKWIEMGAPDPRDGKTKAVVAFDVDKARNEHWAFQPLGNQGANAPRSPNVKNTTWVRSPIDAFILKKLEDKGIAPASEAEPLVWLRRVYLDLIGLPPTPADQQTFAKDHSPEAYGKVVDDLLARPQYGERWGRHWLDVARYGETKGYESDGAKPFAWRYRDWVIDAFNRDLPYDRFVVEQIAGDELPESDAGKQIATSFLGLGTLDTTAADGKQARYDHLDDVIGTTASAFLGMTLQCCRCHDHKFEPLSQVDYYRILAGFEGMRVDAQVQVGTAAEIDAFRKTNEKLDAELMPYFDDMMKVVVPLLEAAEKKGGIEGKKTKLNAKQVGEMLKTLRNATTKQGKPADVLSKDLNKIEDALREIAGADDMQRMKGIRDKVKAIDAKRPQPTLAPAYAGDKTSSGVTKLMIRGEVNKPGQEVAFALPAIFEQSVQPRLEKGNTKRRLWLAEWMTGPSQALTARVMANRLWQYHFGQGFLLDANNLGLGGGSPTHPELLDWLAQDLIQGGWKIKRMHKQIVLSSVYRQSAQHPRPQQDADNVLFSRWPVHRLEAEAIRDSILAISGSLKPDMGGPSVNNVDSPRRSVYLGGKRNAPIQDMALLGAPDSATSCARRVVPTTPVQSLLLLNGKFANGQARLLAERVRKEAGNDKTAQVRLVFELTMCRPPRAEEVQNALAFIDAAPGGNPQEGFVTLCLVLLNTNEFVYRN